MTPRRPRRKQRRDKEIHPREKFPKPESACDQVFCQPRKTTPLFKSEMLGMFRVGGRGVG